jgi:hypothetical protein
MAREPIPAVLENLLREQEPRSATVAATERHLTKQY